MKPRGLALVALAVILSGSLSAQTPPSFSELLEKGIYTEETVGDLDAAIAIYEQIVAEEEAHRSQVARAQFRLGMCNLKMGHKQKAATAFKKLVELFPEEKMLLAQARVRLTELGHTPSVVVRQVWAPATDVLGAPSPDGRHLTFVNWKHGNLALRDLTAGESRDLTAEGSWDGPTQFAMRSIWSPDGQQVAYAWFNKDHFELRIISPDGSGLRVLYRTDDAVQIRPYEWSVDGKQILALLLGADEAHQKFVLISAADGSVRVLKSLDSSYPMKASLSPDGRYVVYDLPPAANSARRDIFLLDAVRGTEIPLVEHPANDYGPIWGPDGRGIVFASDRGATIGAWFLRVRDGKPQGAPKLIKQDMGGMFPIGFTRNGSLFYGVLIGSSDLYVASLDSEAGILSSPEKAVLDFEGFNTSPTWSPDGEHLAYISLRVPVPASWSSRVLVIRSLETGEERELSLPQTFNEFGTLHWSPKGRSILAVGKEVLAPSAALYLVDARTGDLTVVVGKKPGTSVNTPVWSPQGDAIFYNRDEYEPDGSSVCRIMVRNLETGREKELWRGVPPASFATSGLMAVAPDGERLAFVERWNVLKVMPASGGETQELLRLQKGERFAGGLVWTPDGRQVLFGRSREGSPATELWQIPAGGGEARKLISTDKQNVRDLRLHPDGRRIVFSAGGKNTQEVWVMEHILPELMAAR